MKKSIFIALFLLLQIIIVSPKLFSAEVNQQLHILRNNSDGTRLRSIDGGITWNVILDFNTKVLLIGNNGHNFISYNSGINWTSINGSETKINQISVFPNPIVNELNVKIQKLQFGIYDFGIYSMLGFKVYNQKVNIDNSECLLKIDISSYLTGSYNIVLKNSLNEYHQTYFIKY